MTLNEIAPLCPAAEFDPQIVGSMLATLKIENVIHCNGFREHHLLYFFGKRPLQPHEVRESPVTLNTPVAEAAKAIAEMRRRTGTPNPTHAEQYREKSMAKPSLVERCLAALKQHGPCTQEQLAKHTGSTPGSVSTITGQLKARGVQKHQPHTRGAAATYFLPGQKGDALASSAELGKKSTPERGAERQLRAAFGNGGGGAETFAAGPALFAGAIEALEAEKHALLVKMEKVDLAIKAVRALA